MSAAVPDWLPGLLVGWFESTTASDGFGVPSGHAAGATVTYVGLAFMLDRWERRTRLLVGAVIAAAVGLSRIVIELHYLVDFLIGTTLALAVLVLGLRLAGDDGFGTGNRSTVDPTPVFIAAAVVSAAAVAVALTTGHQGSVVNATIGVGTGIGGAVGWRLCSGKEPPVSALVAVPGLGVAGALWVGVLMIEPAIPVAVGMAIVAAAAIVAMPAIGEKVRSNTEAV